MRIKTQDEKLAEAFIYSVTTQLGPDRCGCGQILRKTKPFRDGNNKAVCKDCYNSYRFGR